MQLPRLAVQIGKARLQAQNLRRRRAAGGLYGAGLFLQQRGILPFAVLKRLELRLAPAQIRLDPGEFRRGGLVLHPGGIGLLLLLRQLFLHLSDGLIEERRETPPLQARNIRLLFLKRLLQCPHPGGIVRLLGAQLCQFGLQPLLAGALRL